jgi:hypothetical protein
MRRSQWLEYKVLEVALKPYGHDQEGYPVNLPEFLVFIRQDLPDVEDDEVVKTMVLLDSEKVLRLRKCDETLRAFRDYQDGDETFFEGEFRLKPTNLSRRRVEDLAESFPPPPEPDKRRIGFVAWQS